MFQGIENKTGTISTTAALLSSTVFGFASTNLEMASRAVIFPSSASLLINYHGGTPTTLTGGIPVTSGTQTTVTGMKNLSQLRMIATTTSASVQVFLER